MGVGKRRNQNICACVCKDGIPFSIPCSPPSFTSPVPPTIADDLTDVTVTQLSPVVLTCYASGVPPPMVSWSKEGAQLGSRGGGYRVLPTGTGLGQHCPGGRWVPASSLPAFPCLLSSQGPWRSGRCCLHTPATTPARRGTLLAQSKNTFGLRCMVCFVPVVEIPVPWSTLGNPRWAALPCCL